ncbi:sucrose-phosphate phosphatase [Phormidesmis priestleyi ULC007]|uniref:sucrose-phosphate phosphatase n=1 Tax=Phormidesmis priestleyi ULC007 TaxID=1920490 RepID=A0A2T1DC17_9CYAN|nr:sucrose-phosphate phosphatase [Phormidesmis priestleyi]PSB18006.1 sucrose-phosphate phosphatase [Phormidesmis priestleyi ULC007]PZO49346.1 MAG: sucrose-phosphate phosphatase [Phormidesmis priestleyi]
MTQFLLVTDLDNTLVGDDRALDKLNQRLTQCRQVNGVKLVYSTGRSITSYQKLSTEVNLLEPDVLITAVGTEIYYPGKVLDQKWTTQSSAGWNRDAIVAITQQFPQLVPQPESEQRSLKVSFLLDAEDAHILPDLEAKIKHQGVDAQLIYSSNQDLDILSSRANKGNALAYIQQVLGFEFDRTIACGDSGNDIALFEQKTLGVIMGNAQPELLQWHHKNLSDDRYLAQGFCAAGILEGLQYFGFLQ